MCCDHGHASVTDGLLTCRGSTERGAPDPEIDGFRNTGGSDRIRSYNQKGCSADHAEIGFAGKVKMKRKIVVAVVAVVVLFLAIQVVPVDRTNPPVVADFDGPPDVARVLRTSCYDCHSNETDWPWYSRVAPASWLVAHDVEEARGHLNFSSWGAYDEKRRVKLAEEIWEEVEEGEMPLKVFLIAHPDARLSEAAKATLRDWSRKVEPSLD